MDHLEDRVILEGVKGGEQAIKILNQMGGFLSGMGDSQGVAVTTKWDGAPAIICGIDPEDGQFFVGTKSVFAQSPKICKSENDCYTLYDGVLANKLATSYRYLKNLDIKGVLQGDLMFTNDVKSVTIDKQQYLAFHPNTITYAVRRDSPMAKDIVAAKMGIVFHTKYEGDSLSNMNSSFKINKSDFKDNSREVWTKTAEFKNIGGVASMTTAERVKYQSAIKRATGSLKQSGDIANKIQSGKKALKIDTEFLKFFNNYVKQGRPIPSVKKAYDDFFYHLGKEYDKAIQKNKTLKTQANKADLFMKDVDFLLKHRRQVEMLIATYMNIQVAKHILVDKMNKISDLNMFVETGNGDYKVTTPEGFVAISGKDAVKLVDRLEFSKLNFIVPKSW